MKPHFHRFMVGLMIVFVLIVGLVCLLGLGWLIAHFPVVLTPVVIVLAFYLIGYIVEAYNN